MKILLINPCSDLEIGYGRFRHLAGALPSLGLAYIASVLETNGYNVQILDANVLQLASSEIVSNARQFSPDIIGITALTMTYYQVKSLAYTIKQTLFKTPIVIGGAHVTGVDCVAINEDCFDFMVYGEGEITMLDLVEAIKGLKPLEKVEGIAYKEREKVFYNNPRQVIKDLDELPLPARHLLPPLNLYRPKAISYKRLPSTQIFTSRGCPYQCIFCRTAFGRSVRFHSPQYVIAEIKHLISEYGIREIIINDDTFVVDRDRVIEICDRIIRERIDITWSCNVRANLVDKALLQKMKNAGCWEVAIGLESGRQEILNTLKKGITLEQGKQVCQWAYEVGLYVRPSFIIGNPLETLESIEETIRYAMSLPVHYPSFSLMTPFPGTELWESASQFGYFDASDLSNLSLSSKASFIPKGLNAKILEKKQKEAYRRVYLRPSMIWRHIRGIREIQDVIKIEKAFIELMK